MKSATSTRVYSTSICAPWSRPRQRRSPRLHDEVGRVRSPQLWVIPSHPRQAPPPAHCVPRDGISGGPREQSRRPRGVIPAWPFVFCCLAAKIGTVGERPLLARSGLSQDRLPAGVGLVDGKRLSP